MARSDDPRTDPEVTPEAEPLPTSEGAPEAESEAAEVERAARALFQTLIKASEVPPIVISGAQLSALRAVERRLSLSVAQLAEELGTIPSWASRLCDRLEADGYIQRRRSEGSRRQVTITLTAPGQRLLSEIELRRRQALVGVLERMTASEREALRRGLVAFTRARDTGR